MTHGQCIARPTVTFPASQRTHVCLVEGGGLIKYTEKMTKTIGWNVRKGETVGRKGRKRKPLQHEKKETKPL